MDQLKAPEHHELETEPETSSRPPSHADVLREAAQSSDRQAGINRVRALTEQLLASAGTGLNLTQSDLSGLDLSGMDLRHAVLNRASLFGTRLVGANLRGAALVCAGIERTDFTDAVLAGAYVHSLAAQASTFERADLSGLVDATGALFHGCNLTDANLAGAEIAGTSFYQCSFAGADLTGADLHGSLFNESRLDRADLSRANLSGTTFLRSGMTGLVLKGARGSDASIQRPTTADGMVLSGANLAGLKLVQVRAERLDARDLHAPGIDVGGSDLPGADFTGADLTDGRWIDSSLAQATFDEAALGGSTWTRVSAVGATLRSVRAEAMTCTECSFVEAILTAFAGRYATFRGCDLRNVDLSGAYLYRAVIVGDPPPSARLTGATLDGANLTQAYLAADLTGASIRHAWATYARINQSIFADADLRGTSLFRASAVKTDFTSSRLGGQRGLLFADRCAGLAAALGDADPGAKRVGELVDDLTSLLAHDTGKST
ncbi:pentapeptide repeat-containing protein [Promicromonospora sukumoe]|uniref:pentapeptide repeat-containing protein n=1 Tax=Promicromonospora sukumoe TaxID=88382 RepID=UPI0036661677